ncbi:MAG TPA: dihydroorotate dehydrogenase electron transfer subunit [Pirellulaceae bacterium]
MLPSAGSDSSVQAVFQRAAIVSQHRIGRDTYRLSLECPEIARAIHPGQFIMVRIAGTDDPLLGRPFALYDTRMGVDDSILGVDLVYLVMGRMTTRLSDLRIRQEVDIWGPLGNGFSPAPCTHLIMVAGGIGQTPFVALANEALGRKRYGRNIGDWAGGVTLCYGARTADYLAGLDDFQRAGVLPKLATDDGSRGHHGYVTDLLRMELEPRGRDSLSIGDGEESRSLSSGVVRVVCCGPEPMMQAVAAICEREAIPCQVSLETPMACGIGACFTCVAPIRTGPDGDWDYRRTCLEGPVFDAAQVVWEA